MDGRVGGVCLTLDLTNQLILATLRVKLLLNTMMKLEREQTKKNNKD